MKRLQQNFVAAALVFGLGGGAFAYMWTTRVSNRQQTFRDQEEAKRLFRFGRIHVSKVELLTRGSTLTFAKGEGDSWALTAPVRWAADLDALYAAIDGMAGIKLDPIIERNAAAQQLEAYGLAHPRVRMKVKTTKGNFELRVGVKNELQNRYPVTDGEQKLIGLSDTAFYSSLDRAPEDFRDKRLFPMRSKDLVAIETSQNGKMRYSLQQADGAWTVSDGSGEPAPADADSVNLLAVALTKRLKAKSFLTDDFDADSDDARARYGLGAEAMRIVLRAKGGATAAARLGSYGETASEEGTQVLHLEGTKTVVEVPTWFAGDVTKSVEELRDRTVARFDDAAVTKLVLYLGSEKPIVVERQSGPWRITAPESRPTKTWKIDAIVRKFSRLRSLGAHDREPTRGELKEWMIDPPSRRLVFHDGEGSVLADVRIGNYATEETIFIKTSGTRRVDTIPGQQLTVLPTTIEDLVDKDAERAP